MKKYATVITAVAILIAGVSLWGFAGTDEQPVKSDQKGEKGLAPSAARSFVGTWMVTVPKTARPKGGANLISLFADGTVITAQEAPLVPEHEKSPFKLLYRSAGHGAWTSTDTGTAKVTFVYMLNDEQGRSFGTVTVNANMKVSEDGQTLSGEVSGAADAYAGKEAAARTSKVTGKRIVASR
jgi:hypothetical protein